MDANYTQLSTDCLLHFTGTQVPNFLQGQLTCDCLQVSESQSVAGALCSVQGRVITDCRVLQLGDGHYALRLGSDVRDITRETLEKYAMFSRTAISQHDDEWSLLGVWGEGAAAAVQAACDGCPDGRDACFRSGDLVACQADDTGEAFELAVRAHALPGVRALLASHATERTEKHWQQNELRRGLVRITAELSGRHVPQVLNYDLAGLLDFRKGCYIGQEVVARLHYKGKSKRRCGVYSVAADATVGAGAGLVTGNGERQAGSVLRLVKASGEPTLAVALVSVDAGEQTLASADAGSDSPLLQPVPLPYSVRGSSAAS